jgi:hypothetical protein
LTQMIWCILQQNTGTRLLRTVAKKKKHKEHEVVVTYKSRRSRATGMDPVAAWHIELDHEHIGSSTTLNGVSSILYDMGYKVWAFRRQPDKKGRPRFVTTAIRYDKDKDH